MDLTWHSTNKYPIEINIGGLEIGIPVIIKNDAEMLAYTQYPNFAKQMERKAVFHYFFPERTDDEMWETFLRLSIYDRDSIKDVFEKVKNYYFKVRDETARNMELKEALQQTVQAVLNAGGRSLLTQEDAACAILRAEGKDPDSLPKEKRENRIKSAIRRIQRWDQFINSGGKNGTKPPAGYSRDKTPEGFAYWAADWQRSKRIARAYRQGVKNARTYREGDGAVT